MNNLRYITNVGKIRQWPVLYRYMAQKVQPKVSASSSTHSGRESDEVIDNEPIPFFGSQAATWRAEDARGGRADEYLWYQPYVISGSLAVFLLYFCALREESDVDLKLDSNLYDHVPDLEQVQLTVNYKYNKNNGLDNSKVIERLEELGVDVKMLDDKIAEDN